MNKSREFPLQQLEDPRHAKRAIAETFGCRMLTYEPVGWGFYGVVYRAEIDQAPGQVILKWQKFPGWTAREQRNLDALRPHSRVKIPDVYGLYQGPEEAPFECILMELLPGVKASDVKFPNPEALSAFADEIVENLLGLHAVHHPEGFGDLDGPFFPTWLDFYKPRVDGYYQGIQVELGQPDFPAFLRDVIKRSYTAFDQIFTHSCPRASLVHSDYNVWNYMVDPQTCRATGIIDPLDSCWADPEIDLFHLYNGPGAEMGLLERYFQAVPPDEGFFLRSYFYRFWDDIRHYNNLPGPLRPYIIEGLDLYGKKLWDEMEKSL